MEQEPRATSQYEPITRVTQLTYVTAVHTKRNCNRSPCLMPRARRNHKICMLLHYGTVQPHVHLSKSHALTSKQPGMPQEVAQRYGTLPENDRVPVFWEKIAGVKVHHVAPLFHLRLQCVAELRDFQKIKIKIKTATVRMK